MNGSTLLVLWLQSGFVLALALVACLAARRTPSLRLAIVRVAMLASIGLCVFLPWLGNREAPVVPIEWTVPTAVIPLADFPTENQVGPVATVGPASIPTTPAPEALPTPFDPLPWALGVWAIGVTFLSVQLGLGYGALARTRKSSAPVTDPQVQALLQEAVRKAQVSLPLLLESEEAGSPFVAGALRPAIYLPKGWVTSVEPETIRAVLAHELAHIANKDLRWSLVHRLLSIALWPQPLLWLLKRPMVAASEELCDRQVMNAGIAGERYAACLLKLRESLQGKSAPTLAIGAVTTKSQLGQRIEAILDARRSNSVRLSRATILMTRLGAVAIAIGATLIFARPIAQVGPAIGPNADGGSAFGPFKLKNGAVVRLAYVQDDSTGKHTIWKPDGTAPLAADVNRSLDMSGFAPKSSGPRSLFLRIDIEGVMRGDYYCLTSVPHQPDWSVWQTYGEGGNSDRSMDMASFQAPADLASTDLKFGIAAGPKKPFATWKSGQPLGKMRIDGPPQEWGLGGGPEPTFSVKMTVPPTVDHALMNMDVYGKQGKKLTPMIVSTMSEIDEQTGKRTRNFVFTGGPASDISRIEVSVRDYEWVTFQGIHLYPNK